MCKENNYWIKAEIANDYKQLREVYKRVGYVLRHLDYKYVSVV